MNLHAGKTVHEFGSFNTPNIMHIKLSFVQLSSLTRESAVNFVCHCLAFKEVSIPVSRTPHTALHKTSNI